MLKGRESRQTHQTGGSLFQGGFLQKAWIDNDLGSRQKKSDDFRNAKISLQSQLSTLRNGELTTEKAWVAFKFAVDYLADWWGINPFIPLSILLLFAASVTLYIMMTAAVALTGTNVRHMATFKAVESTTESNFIRETAKTMITLRANDSSQALIASEQFMVDNLERTCLQYLEPPMTDDVAVETFHFNLAKILGHVAKGGTFVHYTDLKMTSDGGIVDPHESHETAGVLEHLQSCPLLEVVFQFGLLNSATVLTANSGENTEKKSVIEDYTDEFDEKYDWSEINEGVKWLSNLITKPKGKCSTLGEALSQDSTKWFKRQALVEMLEIAKKPELAHKWTHYMVDTKGNIHAVENVSKYPQFVWCLALEKAFNSEHIWKEKWMTQLTQATLRKLVDDQNIFG